MNSSDTAHFNHLVMSFSVLSVLLITQFTCLAFLWKMQYRNSNTNLLERFISKPTSLFVCTVLLKSINSLMFQKLLGEVATFEFPCFPIFHFTNCQCEKAAWGFCIPLLPAGLLRKCSFIIHVKCCRHFVKTGIVNLYEELGFFIH